MQRVTLQAAGIGFGVMLLAALTIALLAEAGVVSVSAWGVFGLGLASFAVARVWMRRR